MSERPCDELNFCRVFELPLSYPEGYCFSGGKDVRVKMVDWFNPWPHPELEPDLDTWDKIEPLLRRDVSQKVYIRPGRRYVLVTDFGKAMVIDGNAKQRTVGDTTSTEGS